MKDEQARLNLKLSPKLLEQAKMAAKKRQLTVSAFVRLLILDYLAEELTYERK